MNDRLSTDLRRDLEAWEQAAAAQWDRLTRSPDVLRRLGNQLSASLTSRQRIDALMQRAFLQTAAARPSSRELERLEQLEAQVARLVARIERLEDALRDE
ncbi:MAG: hypothetical protein GXY36_15665 [Chloroflexi bacterium]|jgi:hypothetical protein|nr:hypothetical protein [Chloroflexota bacterium]